MGANNAVGKKYRLSDILLIIMVVLLAASLVGMFVFKGQSKKKEAQLKEHSANTAAVMYEILRHDVRDDLTKATKTEHYMSVADKVAMYKKIPYCGYPSGIAQVIYSYLFQLEKDTYDFADSLRVGGVENQDAGRSRLIKSTEVIGTLCGLADEYISGKLPKDTGIKNEKDMIKELKKSYDSQMTGQSE